MNYPGGVWITYEYNTASDITKIKVYGTGALATYGYDDLGRRTSLTRGNGVVTSYTYDAVSRLATLVQNPTGTSYDTTFGFSYNPAGQITSRTRSNSTYDWILPASFNESYSRNGLDQYTNVAGDSLSYDTRGNLTNDGIKTYGYDYDNRLTSASGGVTLAYDPKGRLHQVAGGSTTRFLYDGADMIAEYNASGTVLRRYVHGPGLDEPLVRWEGGGTSNPRYLITDERGTVIGETNSSGTVTQVNRYDADGVPSASNQGRFQYTGQMWIDELDLYHYKARAYHPWLGRFMQTDPIGYNGGMNLYGYVGNDPVNFADPSGLEPLEEIVVTGTMLCPLFSTCYGLGSYFPVPYIGGYSLSYGTLLAQAPTGGTGGGSTPTKPLQTPPKTPPPTQTCTGNARILAGNPKHIGGPGGFGPSVIININSVAIDPFQWGGINGKGNVRPHLNNISGSVNGIQIFNNVAEVIGGRSPIAGMNVRDALRQLNPNTLILELPAGKDMNTVPITLTIPSSLSCPTGTK